METGVVCHRKGECSPISRTPEVNTPQDKRKKLGGKACPVGTPNVKSGEGDIELIPGERPSGPSEPGKKKAASAERGSTAERYMA